MDSSKINKVVMYMRTHTGITQMEAYELCKATRLSAIIFHLREQGFEIKTIYHPLKNGRYAEYQLTNRYKKYLDELEAKK